MVTPDSLSRIRADEARKLVNWTLPIPGDPEHYVVQLSVFHELHCLVSFGFILCARHEGRSLTSQRRIKFGMRCGIQYLTLATARI